MSPKRRTLAYRLTTGLFVLGILPGAVMDITQPQMVLDIVAKLQIPLYVLTFLGVCKILGAIALALPRFQRLNEWAYAGFVFDLVGAAYWHAAAGDWPGAPVPLAFLALLMASYVLRGRLEPTG